MFWKEGFMPLNAGRLTDSNEEAVNSAKMQCCLKMMRALLAPRKLQRCLFYFEAK